jgi:hypothetical protein
MKRYLMLITFSRLEKAAFTFTGRTKGALGGLNAQSDD